jgi:hypothetical protein
MIYKKKYYLTITIVYSFPFIGFLPITSINFNTKKIQISNNIGDSTKNPISSPVFVVSLEA